MLRRSVCRGRAGVTCAGAKRGVAALVAAAVEDALTAFGGTRGPKPSDETLWAAIAWRIGAENFYHAVIEKIAENKADGWPKNPAAAFQAFLDRRYPKENAHFGEMRPRESQSCRSLARSSRGGSSPNCPEGGLEQRPPLESPHLLAHFGEMRPRGGVR